MDELIKRARDASALSSNGEFLIELADALTIQQSRITALEDEVKALRKDANIDKEEMLEERLPDLARTADGQRLYSLAYARGRKRGRLDAGKSYLSAQSSGKPSSREMRVILPEGGALTVQWPDWLTADSALMLSEMFSTLMQSFAKAIEKAALSAASDGGKS